MTIHIGNIGINSFVLQEHKNSDDHDKQSVSKKLSICPISHSRMETHCFYQRLSVFHQKYASTFNQMEICVYIPFRTLLNRLCRHMVLLTDIQTNADDGTITSCQLEMPGNDIMCDDYCLVIEYFTKVRM